MFRDGRHATISAEEAAQADRRGPFWTTVSRLLSAPGGLLFNFRSRYSLRYRTRARIQPWGGGTPRSRCTLKQRYCASAAPGAAGLSPRRAGLSRAARPRAAHALNLGPGSAPFARRYSGHRVCFLFLGLLICLSSARRRTWWRAGWLVPKMGAAHLSSCAPLHHMRGSPHSFEK